MDIQPDCCIRCEKTFDNRKLWAPYILECGHNACACCVVSMNLNCRGCDCPIPSCKIKSGTFYPFSLNYSLTNFLEHKEELYNTPNDGDLHLSQSWCDLFGSVVPFDSYNPKKENKSEPGTAQCSVCNLNFVYDPLFVPYLLMCGHSVCKTCCVPGNNLCKICNVRNPVSLRCPLNHSVVRLLKKPDSPTVTFANYVSFQKETSNSSDETVMPNHNLVTPAVTRFSDAPPLKRMKLKRTATDVAKDFAVPKALKKLNFD
jgi:hypothetical protein